MAEKKLCSLVKSGFLKEDPKAYQALLQPARHMCKKCGRLAAKSKCLCKPVKL